MSELLFENPVMIGVAGAMLTLIAAVTWIKGGYSAALYAALALFLLTILLVIMNIQIQSDREKVEGVIGSVAKAVERNDLDEVLKYVHSTQSAALNRAKTELPNFKFTMARITGIKKIEVDAAANPPSAIAEFNVAVDVTAQGQPYQGIRRFVHCKFLREGERWLVNDYEHFEPTHGFRNDSER